MLIKNYSPIQAPLEYAVHTLPLNLKLIWRTQVINQD
jgi:hypothetical protein